jgi:GNAT superfamily N-acetyltransferase
MKINIIPYNSPSYHNMVALRYKVLRAPLGLDFTPEQLQPDENRILIGAFQEDTLTGCCILSKESPQLLQLRQMAVDDQFQGLGIGKMIVDFAEQWAISHHFSTITLHARYNAVPFYEKLGYIKKGNPFTEVTIEHFVMEKVLSK